MEGVGWGDWFGSLRRPISLHRCIRPSWGACSAGKLGRSMSMFAEGVHSLAPSDAPDIDPAKREMEARQMIN
jgi:hypothetical protein